MMQQQDPNVLLLKFTPQSMRDIQDLAKSLNTTVNGVVGQALALLKAAQGRTIVLKKETQSLEISNYVSLPTQFFNHK